MSDQLPPVSEDGQSTVLDRDSIAPAAHTRLLMTLLVMQAVTLTALAIMIAQTQMLGCHS